MSTLPEPGEARRAAADRVARHQQEGTGGGTAAGTVSQRNPYVPPVPRTWFLANAEYRGYALREFSAFVVGLFVFNLMVGMVAISAGETQWERWVDLQRNPVVIVLTGLALLAAVVHTVSWFQLTPAIIKVRRGARYLADGWVVAQHVVLLVVFAVVMVVWLGSGR